jgi:hypothetical protein
MVRRSFVECLSRLECLEYNQPNSAITSDAEFMIATLAWSVAQRGEQGTQRCKRV